RIRLLRLRRGCLFSHLKISFIPLPREREDYRFALLFFAAFFFGEAAFFADADFFLATARENFLFGAVFAGAAAAASCVGVAVAVAALLTRILSIPNSRSRAIVLMRARSLRNSRIFFTPLVCPILSWNFRRKS